MRIRPESRFGRLTVESDSGERRDRYTVWNCVCECGNKIKLSSRDLLQKNVRDCGCSTRVRNGARDLTGQRFGKLVVQYPTDQRADQGSVVWHSVCDCGNECDVSARRLIRGKVKSCGCLSNPPLKDFIGKRFGRWKVTGYAGVGRDLGMDEDNTMNYWYVKCDCGNTGIAGQTDLQNGESQSCGCLRADHSREAMKLIDGTSVAILERTRDTTRSDNTSGKTGVCFFTREQKWVAYMTFKGHRYWLGHFKDKEDAVRSRLAAEEKRDDFLEWYYDEYRPSQEAGVTDGRQRTAVHEPPGADRDHLYAAAE